MVAHVVEVEWTGYTDDGGEAPTAGYTVVPGDKAAISLNPPFATESEVQVELDEIRAMPEPTEGDVDEAAPWPPPTA